MVYIDIISFPKWFTIQFLQPLLIYYSAGYLSISISNIAKLELF